jgi:hypothetical protein
MSATLKLRKAVERGATVVATGEYDGQPVSYLPRNAKDRFPWVLSSTTESERPTRFSGKACRAVEVESADSES